MSATLGSLATRSDPEALAALAHIGELDTALGHAELIQDAVRKSRAYRLIAAALIDRGDRSSIQRVLQEALKAARSINRLHLRCPALCDLATTIFKAGDVELARQAASDAESAARLETSDYFAPKLLIATALAHSRVGNADRSNAVALDALTWVEGDPSYKDDVLEIAHLVCLNALFEKSGNGERAEQVKTKYAAMFDNVNNKIKTEDYVFLGNAGQLSAAFLEIGDSESAAIIAESWMDSWEAAGALARAAKALIESGEIERGTQVADASVEMVREAVKSELYSGEAEERIRSLGSVTEVLGRIGREGAAIDLGNAAPDAEGKSHSLGTLALALAQRDSVDSARRAANASLAASQQLIQDSSTQASWLAAVATTLNKIGKRTEAMELGKRAQSLAENWTGDNRREADSIMRVAETLSQLGRNASALTLIDRIDDFEAKAKGWILIIRSPETAAEERINFAHQVINGLSDSENASKPTLLGRTARVLAEVELDEEAIRVAQLAISASATINDRHRDPAEGLCEVARALALTGRFDQARETIGKVTAQKNANPSHVMNLRVHALSALARAQGDAGQHDEAIATIDFAQELIAQDYEENYEARNLQSDALIEIAKTLTHLGNADAANQANRRALDLVLKRLKELGA